MGRTELNEDDLKTVVEHFIRYSPAKPREAIERLLKIELIRNNYTKNTIYCMFQRIKRAVNTGINLITYHNTSLIWLWNSQERNKLKQLKMKQLKMKQLKQNQLN